MVTLAQQLYDQTIHRLPAPERLRLAALILNDLTTSQPEGATWSAQDRVDVAVSSMSYATDLFPEEEDLV